VKANAVQGPIHPTLGIAMDMSIQLKAANGAICTLSACRSTTTARWAPSSATSATPGPTSPATTTSITGKEEKIDVSKVDVSMNGIELQDREFFAAIREGREPNSSVAQVLPCYQVLHDLEQQLNAG
jgi:2-hydroxy-4-carboxymuconate semialdehyde hemiacetal dehydrogenase